MQECQCDIGHETPCPCMAVYRTARREAPVLVCGRCIFPEDKIREWLPNLNLKRLLQEDPVTFMLYIMEGMDEQS